MSNQRRDPQKYTNLGEVIIGVRVDAPGFSASRARNIILLLAACVALMMTGFGIIMPVFARRLGEFGEGVEALGLMTVAFALSQLVFAPVLGTAADRIGRRPLILLALAAFIAANIGYLLAPTSTAFILVRGAAGALTAGLFPAAMGVVADIMPEEQRAQWIGIVMAGYGLGFVFGPVLGGILYDGFGFSAPFITSAGLAILAFIAAAILVPETHTPEMRQREMLHQRWQDSLTAEQKLSFWDTLPRPLYVFGTLLFLDFSGSFAFAFVEPQMVFYFYETLEWTTIQFGIVVGAYGLAMVAGQAGLGRSSDRFGRKRVILAGLLLTTLLYIGLAMVTTYGLVLVVAVIAGLGAALTGPALSAFILDITPERHRSRVVGLKESSLALGGVIGPLAVVVVSGLTGPRGVFLIAAALILLGALIALVWLREPKRRKEKEAGNVTVEVSARRCMAAQASLRGIVMRATSTRAARQYADLRT